MNAETVMQVLRGLAHPRRYAIAYQVLHKGPISVVDVYKSLGLEQARTSLDLRALKGAGIVDNTKRSGYVYYEVLPEVEPLLKHIFEASNGIEDLLVEENKD